MTEYVVRFLVGGVVSAFSMLGDLLRPMSFAGLFGAAPSVALKTLGIALYRHGADYAAQQNWAMTAGAIAARCLQRGGMRVPHSRPVACGSRYAAVACCLADRRLRPSDLCRRLDVSPISFSPSSLRQGR
jgi:hypothetical protein